LEPRIKEAQGGTRHLFFMDAAHFVLSTFLSYLWCIQRVFVKSPSGRQRFNVLGAIHAITYELVTVTTDTYINSLSVKEMLEKLAEQFADKPITIVLDNAKYQRCQLVMDIAKELGIELLFLPTYSPNLNIIERLWKFVKNECLYAKYYEKYADFKSAISNTLSETNGKHRKKLTNLLALNFQRFDQVA
jgi:transposase